MYALVGVGTDQRNIHPSIVSIGIVLYQFASHGAHKNNAPDDCSLHNLLCCLIWKVGQFFRLPQHELVSIGFMSLLPVYFLTK